jgi:hypothetical protein
MITCLKCGLDCSGQEGEVSRLCDVCLPGIRAEAKRLMGDVYAARRAQGIDVVHHTELTDSGYRDYTTGGAETIEEQLRYER